MSDALGEATPAPSRSRERVLHRIALLQAVILLVAVVFALPVAFRSMGIQLTERQSDTLYDFPSGQPLTHEGQGDHLGVENFLNIAAVDIDVGAGNVTLAVSGHRDCQGDCTPLTMTLFSLGDDADVRRALPPSVTLNLDPQQPLLSQTVQLPIAGQPSQYPFDDYVLWLGLGGTVTANGQTVPLTDELIDGHAVLTTQNQLRDLNMSAPIQVPPERVRSLNDPIDFVGVQELHFQRPIHLQILAVLLITLIAVSAALAVAVRDVRDLIVGIGSLVLGIWGVRSVLVPQPLPVVTSIDLALSVVILLVLLGLSLRTAQHFHKTAELPEVKLPVSNPRKRRRRSGNGGHELEDTR